MPLPFNKRCIPAEPLEKLTSPSAPTLKLIPLSSKYASGLAKICWSVAQIPSPVDLSITHLGVPDVEPKVTWSPASTLLSYWFGDNQREG